MQEKILILYFGSQYTQLIARRVRELNVYCEIYPYNHYPALDSSVKGVILSGSPFSVRDDKAPQPDLTAIKGQLPLLGVCFGAQYLAHHFGGEVKASNKREYGRANLAFVDKTSKLFKGIGDNSQVWMSHGDTIEKLPAGCQVIASTKDVKNAAFKENLFAFLYKNVVNIYNKILLDKKRSKEMRKNREIGERINASLLANLLFSRMNLIHIL